MLRDPEKVPLRLVSRCNTTFVERIARVSNVATFQFAAQRFKEFPCHRVNLTACLLPESYILYCH